MSENTPSPSMLQWLICCWEIAELSKCSYSCSDR